VGGNEGEAQPDEHERTEAQLRGRKTSRSGGGAGEEKEDER
jgi:hypothetical protein